MLDAHKGDLAGDGRAVQPLVQPAELGPAGPHGLGDLRVGFLHAELSVRLALGRELVKTLEIITLVLKLEKLHGLFIAHGVLKLLVPEVKAEGRGVQQGAQAFPEPPAALLSLKLGAQVPGVAGYHAVVLVRDSDTGHLDRKPAALVVHMQPLKLVPPL